MDAQPPTDAGSMDVQSPMDAAPSGPVDELDLSLVTWFDPDVSGWPITEELSVSFPNDRDIRLSHASRAGWQPHQNLGKDSSGNDVIVNANAWVFAQHEGKWYGGTFEYLRPGQTIKTQEAVDGKHVKAAPFNSYMQSNGTEYNWRPQSGADVYFMVSGVIRRFKPSGVQTNVMLRTNVVRVSWP